MDVIERESGAPDRPRGKRGFVLDYDKAPPIGTEISCHKRGRLTLFRVELRKVAVEKHGPVLLRWRSGGGAEYTSGLCGGLSGPVVPVCYRLDLTVPPEIGTVVESQHGPVTLYQVEPRKRDAGRWGPFLLRWRGGNGRTYTSGLQGFINEADAGKRTPRAAKPRPPREPDVGFSEVPGIGTMIEAQGRKLVLWKISDRWFGPDKWGPFILHWRDNEGQDYTSGLRGQVFKTPRREVRFSDLPEIGTTLQSRRGLVTLYRADPYTRKRDGAASFILRWRRNQDGATFTSGLRGDLVRDKAAA